MKKQRAYYCGLCKFFDDGYCRNGGFERMKFINDQWIMINAKTSGCKFHSSLRQKHFL